MIKVTAKNSVSEKKSRLDRYLCSLALPLGLIYLELVLQLSGTTMNGFPNLWSICLIAAGLGLVLESLCLLIPGKRGRFWVRFALLEISTVWFLVMYFTDNSYRAFMDPASITQGAGDVVAEFGDTLVTILTSGLPMIIIYHIPVLCYIAGSFALSRNGRNLPVLTAGAAATGIVLAAAGGFLLSSSVPNVQKLTSQYNYDTSMRHFGAIVTLTMDTKYRVFGNPYEGQFEEAEAEPQPLAPKSSSFGRHETDIDFDSLIADTSSKTLKNVYGYLSSLTPASENIYTGLFKGKNLIVIAAEGFSAEVIDEQRTPTLYRMAHQGIYFSDYYQPAWGGSTSTGEFSILTGIIPTSKVNSIQEIVGHDMAYTIFNQLKDEGYYTAGFHDGEYTYYDRHITHKWLGMDNWMGRGNGMEKGCSAAWPESDVEMIDYTVPMFIDKQPFCVYYMTISGHCNYSTSGNNMSEKHWNEVKDLDASSTVRAYLSCQMELELALTSLIDQLEAAGIADDTVIVLSTDHYPYGLEKSVAWESSADYLAELYGYPADSNPARDHSALLLWSGCLEDIEPITVDTPVYSLDIVPTLSNLFGTGYDSRLMVGRDVFSSETPLVIWTDYSWMTDKGYYSSSSNTFTPRDGVTVSDTYVETMKTRVSNKFAYSRAVLANDFFRLVLKG